MFGPDARSGLKQEAINGTDVLDGTDDPAAGKREAFGRSRLPTMVNVDGFGQCIAVLTSGGDAQGRKKISYSCGFVERFVFELTN